MAVSKHGPVSVHGPDSHGGFKKGFLANEDGSDALHTHHRPARQHDMPDATAHDYAGHRGHPVGAVVNGKIVRAPGAVDIQPRGGKPKAHLNVSEHLGMRSRTSPLPGMLTINDVNGAPDAVAPNPLDVMTPSQAGKRQPPTFVHDGMTAKQIAAATLNGEDVLREGIAAADPYHPARLGATLPESTTEN
jgi:hypothetical protein